MVVSAGLSGEGPQVWHPSNWWALTRLAEAPAGSIELSRVRRPAGARAELEDKMSRLASGELVNETFTKLYFHIVFSTRNRRPLIKESWRARLHEYVGGTLRGLGAHSVIVGGVADHVHILVGLRPTHRLADVSEK